MENRKNALGSVFFVGLALVPLVLASTHFFIVRPIQNGGTRSSLPFWASVDDKILNRLSLNWQLRSEISQEKTDLVQSQKFAWLALEKNPRRAQNHLRLAEVLESNTEKFLSTAVSLDPHNAYYRLLLAQEEAALGKTVSAQENLDAALASDASTVFTYFLSQKMPIPTLHKVLVIGLEKLIAKNPQSPDAYGYLADWYRYNNQLDLAIEATSRGYDKTGAPYLLKIKERCEYLKEKGLVGP